MSASEMRAALLAEGEGGKGPGTAERMTVDEMLQKHCGEFGRWQARHFVLTSLAWALEAFHTMVMIFADREPEWACVAGSGCDSAAAAGLCGNPPGTWRWTGPAGAGASTVSEWGLICGDKYKVGLVQAVFFSGCMIGAGIFGHLSDSKLGRKGSLTVVCILNATFGISTALSPNYWIYTLFRFLTGFSTGGVGLCAFVLATEPIGPSKRGIAGMSTFYFFSGGIALLSAIAYAFQSWRHLYIASSIPSFLFFLFVLPFVSESPRWYLVRGRVTQATNLMATIAQCNGRHLPDGAILALDDEASKQGRAGETEEQSGSLIDVIRSPVTRIRLILAVAINFMCAVVYYGLSLNVVNLDTNIYLTVAVNALSEMPAFLLTAAVLDLCGRRPLAVGTMCFSGGFCLAGSVMNGAGNWKILRMGCGVLGIFGMAGTYNLLYIYTAELFPTVVRNAALGSATQASQMGAILAPVVVVLGGGLPFAVFAGCGIAGGALAYYLPETLNKPLYDTLGGLEEGEQRDCLLSA